MFFQQALDTKDKTIDSLQKEVDRLKVVKTNNFKTTLKGEPKEKVSNVKSSKETPTKIYTKETQSKGNSLKTTKANTLKVNSNDKSSKNTLLKSVLKKEIKTPSPLKSISKSNVTFAKKNIIHDLDAFAKKENFTAKDFDLWIENASLFDKRVDLSSRSTPFLTKNYVYHATENRMKKIIQTWKPKDTSIKAISREKNFKTSSSSVNSVKINKKVCNKDVDFHLDINVAIQRMYNDMTLFGFSYDSRVIDFVDNNSVFVANSKGPMKRWVPKILH